MRIGHVSVRKYTSRDGTARVVPGRFRYRPTEGFIDAWIETLRFVIQGTVTDKLGGTASNARPGTFGAGFFVFGLTSITMAKRRDS